MKNSPSPLRSTPPNLDRLAKLETWTGEPLRQALGEPEPAPEPVAAPVVVPTPAPIVASPAEQPHASAPVAADVEEDDLHWIPPKKAVPKMTYSLNLPAALHAKLKRLSERTGESMNVMIVRGAEREYQRILNAVKKK